MRVRRGYLSETLCDAILAPRRPAPGPAIRLEVPMTAGALAARDRAVRRAPPLSDLARRRIPNRLSVALAGLGLVRLALGARRRRRGGRARRGPRRGAGGLRPRGAGLPLRHVRRRRRQAAGGRRALARRGVARALPGADRAERRRARARCSCCGACRGRRAAGPRAPSPALRRRDRRGRASPATLAAI